MQIVVAQSVFQAVQQAVADRRLPVDLVEVTDDGQPAVPIHEATGFFRAFISGAGYERVFREAPKIRWVHTASAGVEGLMSDHLKTNNITLTNSAGVHAVPIAEWVLHALLFVAKRTREMLAAQSARRWDDSLVLDELAGKTLTIFGAGGIGREIARRASAFDMRVWGVNRSGGDVPGIERMVDVSAWHDLLPETNFLVLAAPYTQATHHAVGAHELELLPSHGWLVNIARGGLVDEPALINALQAGTIAGAALDTFDQEPLPPSSLLWTMPNVLISPHRSAASHRTTERVVALFLDNLQRFIKNEPLLNVVDYDQGY